MDRYVYFMRPVGVAEAPVKIGYSWDPKVRASTYSHLSPFPLEVVFSVRGTQALEGQFHCYFAHAHSHHEWFRPVPELLRAIEELRAGSFDFAKLPTGKNQFRQAVARKSWADRKRAA